MTLAYNVLVVVLVECRLRNHTSGPKPSEIYT